jgi:hypothetical protein
VPDEHEKSFLPIRSASQQEMEEDGDGFRLDFRTVFHLFGIKSADELHERVPNETDLVRVPCAMSLNSPAYHGVAGGPAIQPSLARALDRGTTPSTRGANQ